jgi:hypothetical protein
VLKLTAEQKYEIALDMLCVKYTTAAVCFKHGITPSRAYKIRARAREILRMGIGGSPRQTSRRYEQLLKRLEDLHQLVGDQALAIRILKKKLRDQVRRSQTPPRILPSLSPQRNSEHKPN